MNKKFRNWKLILSTNNYHSIFIKDEDSLWLFYNYIDEISEIDDYLLLIPTYQEKKDNLKSGLISRFAPVLKSFIEDKSKRTLIADEEVLNALLKEDKRENFFKFLSKQKKNIIVFCNSDYERYVVGFSRPYNFMVLDYTGWKNSVEIFDRFSDIKIAISNTHNPFKSPSFAFKKYSEDESGY